MQIDIIARQGQSILLRLIPLTFVICNYIASSDKFLEILTRAIISIYRTAGISALFQLIRHLICGFIKNITLLFLLQEVLPHDGFVMQH